MKFVAAPLKKPDDTGYPKCPDCVPADVPAGAPLLKVYDYGPHGARFFFTLTLTDLVLDHQPSIDESALTAPLWRG